MRSSLWMVPLAIIFTFSSAFAADEVAAELDRLQGTWKVVRARREGVDIKASLGYSEFSIEGSATLVKYKGEVRKSTFKLDPTQFPKQVTYTTPKGDTVRGIYQLQGDTLKQLFGKSDGDRPLSFDDPGLFFEYERVKP